MLRAGVLGCGYWANKHAEIMAQMPDVVELVACCDIQPSQAQAFNQRHAAGRAAVYTDHGQMLDAARLDMLVICLPPFAHSDEVEQAARRGVHVLIEKPIALTSAHGWRMVEAAEQAGIVTQVGFMYRFGEAVNRLKTMIDSGQAGPVGLMSARYFCNSLHGSWWIDRSKSGGQVVEQVIHIFDLLRYLMGDPASVFCHLANMFHRDTPGYTVEDVSVTTTRFASGALGVIYATNGAIPNQWINDYRVVAQNVTVDFADANHAVFYNTAQADAPQVKVASDDDVYRLQMMDFINAIQTGRPTRTPIREGAKSLDVVLAAAQSAASGTELALPNYPMIRS
jgi:predicted dehydrogenase